MRRLAWVAWVGLLLTSCSATMRLEATAPTQDNAAPSCAVAPILGPTPAGTILTVWFAWSGPETGSGSVPGLAPGALARLERTVAPGTYTVRAWAVDQAGNTACDTTATFTFKSNPHKVGSLRTWTP